MHRKSWIPAVAFLCLAGSAIAQTVDMKLTGAGGNIYAGVYVNPYTATIDGVTTTVICNDFSASTWVGQEWDATVTYLDGDLTQTKQGVKWMSSGGTLAGLTQHYYAAAYLSTMLLSATGKQAALISFAIWGMFYSNPSALTWMQSMGVSQTDIDAVFGTNGLKNNALAAVGSGTLNFDPSKVAIYSPVSGTATGCPGACPSNSPQEFITVKTPEPSVLSQLGFDLLGFGSVFALVLRGRKGMPAGFTADRGGRN